ncbi:hypothetical protein SAMN05421664_3434 [Chryseobacterium soldanellicola]|uniref:Uncharacterized protein n=1 Tax=Chryseobacterium soldanellicola TaxID=311333 RepID=A0A1H1G3Z1_9FLAO|nr:hypothetical protein [Chryseobacterium soldanellicola]SDR07911.1 hypothetical protein SAMN05421664_3434 [Chryseobacterium soldanellicola]
MKKLIICLAVATVAVSCKKIQAGGNKNTLKLEEGVERYSDDEQTSGEQDNLSEYRGDAHDGHETPAKTDTAGAVKQKQEDKAHTEATPIPEGSQTPKAEH